MPGIIRGHALAVALVLAAGTAGAKPAHEAFDAWAFRKSVTVPALSQPSFVELRLDADVVRDAAPTLADLRLRDDRAVDVPYAVRRRERLTAAVTRETPMADLVTTRDGAVRF